MLTFITKKFTELSRDELYALLSLRSEIFILGQDCAYQDLDYRDQESLHVMGYDNEKLQAYLRILPHQSTNDTMSIGRVLTADSARGKGYGKHLVQHAIDSIQQNHPEQLIIISAQHYLLKFYQDFGFKSVGDIYDEDGIPHIRMTLMPS